MKIALIYMSRHGTTEKLAKNLAKRLSGEVHLFNLAEDIHPNINEFDSLILGGSIHYGSIQREIQLFCRRNLPELLKKRLGLFVCCLLSTRDSDQFERAFPLVLRAHCSAAAAFEGDLIYGKLNALERIVFNPQKEERDVIAINESSLEAFVESFTRGVRNTINPYIPLKN